MNIAESNGRVHVLFAPHLPEIYVSGGIREIFYIWVDFCVGLNLHWGSLPGLNRGGRYDIRGKLHETCLVNIMTLSSQEATRLETV